MALKVKQDSKEKESFPKTSCVNNCSKIPSKIKKKMNSGFFKTPTLSDKHLNKITPKSNAFSKIKNSENWSLPKSKSTPIILEKPKEKTLGTPVTHLCSPSLSPKGRRHFTHHNKCSVKRFLSDSILSDSPTHFNADISTSNNHQEEETSNFVVGVRARPLNLRELSDPSVKNVVFINKEEIQVICDTGAIHSFTYDHCFPNIDDNASPFSSQEIIFNTMVLPLMDQIFLGYNVCLLAYGQTGSGKSYSMMGLDSGVKYVLGKESGVIPRFFQELFNRISLIKEENGDCHVEISYFEIYNEKIHDLLGNHTNISLRKTLKVREHPTFGPYVVDLSAHCVTSFQDVHDWIKVGNSQRITAATGMNEKSSRSHSIFSIMITKKKNDDTYCFKSKVNLVDLAGSERVAQICATGDKLKEGVSINKSLLSLGKVITFLSEKGKKKTITSFGPYRESVLTWLLKESLGGNSRTAMLATISPANIHLDETLATLRYACQARSIVNRVYKNEDVNERVIRELRAEVEKITSLREELNKIKKTVEYTENQERLEEINRLKKQLIVNEELLAKSQLSWAERLQKAENLKAAELQYLKRCGVAIELHCDKKIPCLVNLAADPILTGTLLYLLPPGHLVVGHSVEDDSCAKKPDIGLSGPLIKSRHCEIENQNGKLYLTPIEDCDTFVNGEKVEKRVELNHKDRVVFGGIHYFRVSIPHQNEGTNELVDFDFAHQEILTTQERRLRTELEESKQNAIAKIEAEMESMLGAQKFDYERQINEMISVVEMQKHALIEERKQKHVLEMEKNVLQERVKTQDSSNEIINDAKKSAKKISPYKSTFLMDLKKLLEDKNVDATSYNNCDGISLYEMQVMVQEATHRCKNLELNFQFYQQQVIGKGSANRMVKVVNKNEGLSTLWDPSRFITFINILRESEHKEDIEKMLNDSNFKWTLEGLENIENTISINTDYFRKQLNQNMFQLQIKEASLIDGNPVLENLIIDLKELTVKAQKLANFFTNENSERWRIRINKAMEHFEKFMATIQGKDFDNSEEYISPLTEGFKNKNEKCVRFNEIL